MNRRRFLTMLGLASLVAKFAPVVEVLTPAPAQFVVPPLADEVFKSTPIFVQLKARQVGYSRLMDMQLDYLLHGSLPLKGEQPALKAGASGRMGVRFV